MREFFDKDLERAVIGCFMAGQTARMELLAVREEHFTDLRHASLWRLMNGMDEAGELVTVQTVAANLNRIPEQDRRGIDGVWLFDAYQAGSPAVMAPQLGQRLRNLAQLRRISDALTRSRQMLEGVDDSAEALEAVRDLIDSAEPDGPQGHMLVDEIDETINSFNEQSIVYESPWESLNELLQGWRPGGLYVIGARPGVGKSIMGLQAALSLANIGPVAFNSLEMTRKELHTRIVSQFSGVPIRHLQGKSRGFGGPSELEWQAIGRDLDEIRALPLSIDDRSAISVLDVRAHARSLSRRGKLAGVVVDYLQLMTGRDSRKPRHEVVAEQSRQLKIMAKELECPVIALSQLNRASASRYSGIPSLADLRESGSIEQDADAVLLLHIPSETGPDGSLQPDDSQLVVTVAKNRQGPPGRVTLDRNGANSELQDQPFWKERNYG